MNAPSISERLPGGLAAPALLDSLPDGAYITDCDRRIVYWNTAAERITGWPSRDVVGRTCFDGILAHEDKDGHRLCGQEYCPLHRSIVTRSPSCEPLLVYAQSKSGRRVPVEVSVAPLRDAAGEVVGGIELFRDMTDGVRDLLRAQRIQRSALDCALPTDPRLEIHHRYQPHGIVGGDFFRVERVGADHYVVLLADVMGHGVPSALYTMQLRSLWEDHRSELGSPAGFLTGLNQRLSKLVGDVGYFASAVCVRYNAATGAVACARAGHPAPLLLPCASDADGFGSAQPALGMFPEVAYTEVTTKLGVGEGMLLFTDGAVEVSNAAGEALGSAGLAGLIGEQTGGLRRGIVSLAELEAQLLRFCGGLHLADDLTLLMLTRLAPTMS